VVVLSWLYFNKALEVRVMLWREAPGTPVGVTLMGVENAEVSKAGVIHPDAHRRSLYGQSGAYDMTAGNDHRSKVHCVCGFAGRSIERGGIVILEVESIEIGQRIVSLRNVNSISTNSSHLFPVSTLRDDDSTSVCKIRQPGSSCQLGKLAFN